jgi:hypothetical protein
MKGWRSRRPLAPAAPPPRRPRSATTPGLRTPGPAAPTCRHLGSPPPEKEPPRVLHTRAPGRGDTTGAGTVRWGTGQAPRQGGGGPFGRVGGGGREPPQRQSPDEARAQSAHRTTESHTHAPGCCMRRVRSTDCSPQHPVVGIPSHKRKGTGTHTSCKPQEHSGASPVTLRSDPHTQARLPNTLTRPVQGPDEATPWRADNLKRATTGTNTDINVPLRPRSRLCMRARGRGGGGAAWCAPSDGCPATCRP